MNQRSIVSLHDVSSRYQNCSSIKEMKKQIGGRMMNIAFKHKKKKKNYESLVTSIKTLYYPTDAQIYNSNCIYELYICASVG